MVPVVAAVFAAILFGGLGYFGGQDVSVYPATAPAGMRYAGVAAVIMSGDMGLNIGMGGQMARRLADAGIPVVGINSLSYFRNRRSPAEVEALVERVTRQALALPGINRVVLIGQSFGADMLPIGAAALTPDLRARVAMIGLVVPARTAEFRASPSEIFSRGEPEVDAVPAARALDWTPVVCIRGAAETASLCPALTAANVERVMLPGGHSLHRDTATVLKVLITAIDATAKDHGQ